MRSSVTIAGRRAELAREVQDVAHGGGAEGIDRLGIVADHRQALAARLEREQDRGLEPVGVLVLVDENMVEAPAEFGRDRGLGRHLRPVEQEIVVIEHVLALLGLDIGGEQLAQLGGPAGAPGIGGAQHLLDGHLGIHAAGIDREAGALRGKAALCRREAELVPDEVHQVGRVLAVMDREGGIEADLRRIVAQEPGADAMERAGPGQGVGHHACALAHDLAGDPLDPARHLGGGPAGEGQQKDAAWIGAVDDQMGHAVRERIGLARSRSGDDQQRRRRSWAPAQ